MNLMRSFKNLVRWIYGLIPMKKEIFSVARALWAPPHSVYEHLHFQGTFDVSVPGGRSFKMQHYGYQLENALFWEGLDGWEERSMKLWLRLCKNATCICDIGANTGLYSLVAKAVNPQARVYAFEPVAKVYEKLLLNCQLNNYDVTCAQYAVSNYDGLARIYLPMSDHVYSVTVNKNLNHVATTVREEQVPTIKLSSFIDSHKVPPIDLMKIDVETHEVEVLQGMESHLARMQPSLLIEILNEDVGLGIERLLEGKGYLFFYLEAVGHEGAASHQASRTVRRRQSAGAKDGLFAGVQRAAHIGKCFGNYLLCNEATARRHALM